MIEPLQVSDIVWEKIPGLVIIAGILDIGIPQDQLISRYLMSGWNKLSSKVHEHGFKLLPHIDQWRRALKTAGIPLKKYPPSIQAIAKRTIKNDTPFSINPIVDTYNAISMNLILPFGAWDIDQLNGPLTLRLCDQPEPFIPLGSGKKEETIEGEIVYADNTDILTRHFLWRQADKGKITASSRRFVFVCELLTSMGENMIHTARDTIEEKFCSLLNGDLSEMVILG